MREEHGDGRVGARDARECRGARAWRRRAAVNDDRRLGEFAPRVQRGLDGASDVVVLVVGDETAAPERRRRRGEPWP